MVYHHHPIQSHDIVLLGTKISTKCHIWVPACVVLSSMCVKNFKYIHLFAVHNYIETTTLVRNQMKLSRVYPLHASIPLAFKFIISRAFSYIYCIQFVIFKRFKIGYHLIRSKINYIFLTRIHWVRIIIIWRNYLLFANGYFIIVHKNNYTEDISH